MTDKYGCFDRPPFVSGYAHRHLWIKTFGQPKCQYTLTSLGQTDKRCENCKHKVTK